jgi:subtilisin family serine protease/PKD repeat protein
MRISRITFFLALAVTAFSLAGPARAGFLPPKPGAQGARHPLKSGVFRQMSSAAKGHLFSEDSIIVKFKPGASEAGKEKLHRQHGAKAAKKFARLRMQHVKLKKGMAVEDALKAYRADPDVEYAEPNYLVKALATPNDPFLGNLWGMSRIGAPAAWDVTTGGNSEAVVAVIDTGIDYNHPDLAANIWTNPQESAGNGADNDNNGYPNDIHGIDVWNRDSDPLDDHFHGTHVAGTIGAVGNNALGVVGVNWNVKLMACKFLNADGNGYIEGAIECLEYVKAMKERGVNIVATNNSWGGSGYSQALADAISAQQDILFIAAAGNDVWNLDSTPAYPGGYDLPSVITVAASDENDNLANFSNYGEYSAHVAAPGTDIYSTAPGGSYQSLNGTSMAAPHVAGLAALLRSSGHDWKQAKNLILSGGDPVAGLADTTITGRRVNAYNSLTCSNRPFFALRPLPGSVQAGVPVTLSAISINCGAPAGPVSVSYPGGTIQLLDDGIAPDRVAGDGVFAGTWVPADSGGVLFAFRSPAGSRSIVAPALAIAPTATVTPPATVAGHVVSANLGTSISETLSASGGILPYSWSITSGTLPAGFTLNGLTGRISGTAAETGIHSFTVQVADAMARTDSGTWSLVIRDLRPGYPLPLPNMGFETSAPVFADLDADGKQELIVAGMYDLSVFNENGVVANRSLPGQVFSTPAVTDLFNDGAKQIIVSVGWPAGTAPVYVYDKDLNPLPGFPAGGYPAPGASPGYCGSPVVADLNNDGNKTILVDCTPVEPGDPNYLKHILVMVDAHGGMVSGWPVIVSPLHRGEFDTMPVVGDLYNDGKKEVLLLGADGVMHVFRKDGTEIASWVAAPGATDVWRPVLADIDGDGLLEIAVKQNFIAEGFYGVPSQRISVFNRSGGLLPGWPREFNPVIEPNQALTSVTWGTGGIYAADINGDGRAELITNLATSYYVWAALSADGSPVPNWPLPQVFIDYNSHLVVGDIRGSGAQDAIFYSSPYLYGYSGSGALLPGFPKPGVLGEGWMGEIMAGVRSSPALGDLDGNGRTDIAVKAGDGSLLVWETGQSSSALGFQWPMYGHDAEHTGTLPVLPGVNFSPSRLYGNIPLLVEFTDTSTTSPVSWFWDFGDGGTSTLRNPQHSYTKTGTYTVSLSAANPSGSAVRTKQALIVATTPLVVATSTLPNASVGVPYSHILAGSGGQAPYSWSVAPGGGDLPIGFTLDGSTGVISGTAAEVINKGFTIQVADARGASASKALLLRVFQSLPLTISTSTLPAGTVGVSYSQALTAGGGAPPYTWTFAENSSAFSGGLPGGLSLDGVTGAISGVPAMPGAYVIYPQVADAAGYFSKRVSLAINDACGASMLRRVDQGGTVISYTTFGSMYAPLADNDRIQLRAGGYSGHMSFTKDLRVSLKGGYDCYFSSNEGSSQIIAGTLRVGNGTVKIDKLRFR